MSATKTKGKRTGYLAVISETEKPLADRRKVVQGREGKVVPRKFHLSDAEIDQLQAAHRDGDKFPNPHNKGAYYYLVESLKKLGLNRKHSLVEVKATMRDLMSDKGTNQEVDGKTTNAWQRFNKKDPRNEDTGLDTDGRIRQNLEVLQRVNLNSLTPYGLKIMQVGQKVLKTKGAVIDLLRGTGEDAATIYVRLNTDSDIPANEFRRAGVETPATPAKRKPAKKASKPKVAKPKAEKKESQPEAKPEPATGGATEPETVVAEAPATA